MRSVCLQQLHQADERTKGVVATIDEFVSFCARLSEAENHILVPSGQYTIKQVPARLEHDVENQKARELMELPKYTAFTKMHQEANGTQAVWKGKIQTLKLPPGPEDYLTREVVKSRRLIIDVQSTEYLKWRDRIAEEIAKRQEKWRAKVTEKPPATQRESKPEILKIARLRKRTPFRFSFEDILWVPKEPVVVPEDEPPPSHS